MSYPENLNDIKSIQNLLFKKEFAELKLELRSNNNKKENEQFNELVLDNMILKTNNLILHSHQLFVKNLINPNTPYKRLLLKHSTGSGKTIASLCIAMNFIKYYKLKYSLADDEYAETPYIYIIGFSKNIFQKELLRRPEFGFISKEEIIELRRLKYLAETGSSSDMDVFNEFESRIKKRLSRKRWGGFFRFMGYKEFFNRLFIFDKIHKDENLTNEEMVIGLKNKTIKLNYELVDSFQNSILICDEIHNVYNSSEINNYGIAIKMIVNLFDAAEKLDLEIDPERIQKYKNSILRVLYMSATPINNSPTEIIDLLNILIPIDHLPNQKDLKKRGFFRK